ARRAARDARPVERHRLRAPARLEARLRALPRRAAEVEARAPARDRAREELAPGREGARDVGAPRERAREALEDTERVGRRAEVAERARVDGVEAGERLRARGHRLRGEALAERLPELVARLRVERARDLVRVRGERADERVLVAPHGDREAGRRGRLARRAELEDRAARGRARGGEGDERGLRVGLADRPAAVEVGDARVHGAERPADAD